MTAGEKPVFFVIEANDLMNALDADIECAAILRDGLGIIPSSLSKRRSVGSENRRHLGIGDANRPRSVVEDAASQPPSLVAQGDEMRAVRRNANGRNTAKVLVGGAQHQTTAEFEQAELPSRGIARVES